MKIPFLIATSVCKGNEKAEFFLSGLTKQVEALHLAAQAILLLSIVIKSDHSVFHDAKLIRNKKLRA